LRLGIASIAAEVGFELRLSYEAIVGGKSKYLYQAITKANVADVVSIKCIASEDREQLRLV
jgi:hypothetical protein